MSFSKCLPQPVCQWQEVRPSKLNVSAARLWETRVNLAIKLFQDPVCFVSFVSFSCLQTTCLSLIFLNPRHLKDNCAQTLHPFLTKMTLACHENCQGRVYKETLHNKSSWCSRGKVGFPIPLQACSSAIPSALTAICCLSEQWKIHKLHLDYRSMDGW